ncbi:MAG: helix-turn-helix domain-containing protein [Clostridia bacterium]|nr:helix-turn-helix domain-containing protein [Clostridia bacterium]
MFWKIFISLCEEKNESPTSVCSSLGFSATMATKWKNGAQPRDTTLKKIANYFGVSVDYLLGKPQEPQNKEIRKEYIELDLQSTYKIPIFESVSAGFGAYASNDITDYTMLYFSSEAEAKETICIKVRGDSMYPKIEDGDLIQVHKQDSVDNGALAVVLVDGEEGLVKNIFYGSNWIELHSTNPMYQPMRFDGSDVLRIRVVGLVTKIIKNVSSPHYFISPAPSPDNKKELLALIDILDEDQLKQLNDYVDFIIERKKKKQ